MGFLSANGSFVLFLPESRRVLNCGDHDGSASITLSRCGHAVVCICPDIASAQEVQQQLVDQKVNNVLLVVGSEVALPFLEKTFSLVIHHFFSWGWFSLKAGISRIARGKQEFFRVVEAKGTVYTAYETQGKYLTEIGRKGLLLWNLFETIVTRKLSLVSTIFHYESFQELHFIRGFSLDNLFNPSALYFFLKRCVAGSNIGFVFSGIPDEHDSLLLVTQIKERVFRATGDDPGNVVCYRIGSGGAAIVEFSDYIIKIPLIDDAVLHCANNYKALQLITEMEKPFIAPMPVLAGTISGFHFYCETKLSGVSLDLEDFSESQKKQLEKMAVKLVSSSSMKVCEANSTHLKRILDPPFMRLKQFVAGEKKILFDNVLENIREIFLDEHLPLVIVHGDFKKSNFIVQSLNFEGFVGIIDWECMEIPGFPLVDLLRFYVFDVYGWEDDNVDIIPDVWEMVQKNEYPDAVVLYCESFGIPLYLLPALYLVFLAGYLCSYCMGEIQLEKEYRDDVLGTKFIQVLNEYDRMEGIE